jgi:ketosteroid isomerase-like protein
MTDPRIQLGTDLFAAWSSGDPDAPAAYLHPEAVLSDIVGGEHRGWPAIRAFFANGVQVWPDLELVPTQWWTSDDGVALSWVMSATVTSQMGKRFGAEHVGKKWTSDGMTWLRIRDGLVVHEVDYHDGGAPLRSLQSASAAPAEASPSPAASGGPVEVADLVAIQRLVHRYADAVVRRDPAQWSECWAEDATWELGRGREAVGRAAITDLWTTAMASMAAVVQTVDNGDAWHTSGDRDHADGRFYITETFRRTDGHVGILRAHYDDAYVRTADGWRFARRALGIHYHGSPDLSGAFVEPVAGA